MASARLSGEDILVLQPPLPSKLEELDHTGRLLFAALAANARREPDPTELLADSARFLEQRRAIAGIAEAIHLHDIRTLTEFRARADEVVLLARRLTRIDPIEVLVNDEKFSSFARGAAGEHEVQEERPDGFFEGVVRAVQSLVAYCPIDDLVAMSRRLDREVLGHRCRLSYDWLRAFSKRNALQTDSAEHVVGRAFAEGRLSLHESAALLGFGIPDAVAWLEDQGYARDIDVIAMSSQQESARLGMIRSERLRRGGMADPKSDLILRDAIASQRIEDVDARPWVPNHLPN